MSFTSFLEGSQGAEHSSTDSSKKDETKKDDPSKKKEEEHKSGSDQQQHDSDNTSSATHWMMDLWNSGLDTLHGVYDSYAKAHSPAASDQLAATPLTVTNANGDQVDGKGNIIKKADATVTGKPGDAAEKVATQDVNAPAQDNWDYNKWFNLLSKDKPNEPKPPEKSAAEKVVDWVSDKWDKFVGSGQAKRFETTDANGGKATTTTSDKGVDHTAENGSVAHSDRRGTVEKDKDGTIGYHTDGKSGEKYNNGSEAHKNADGSFDVTTEGGHKVHVAADGTMSEIVNGHKIEVKGDRAVRWAGRVPVGQYRHGDNQTGEQEDEASRPGKGGVTADFVQDKRDGTQMIVVNDGNGNVVKMRHNGERIFESSNNPGVEIVTHKDDDAVELRAHGRTFHLQKQQGEDGKDRWYVYDKKENGKVVGWINDDGKVYAYDENDPSKVGPQLAEVKGLTASGDIQTGAATVGPGGQVQLDQQMQAAGIKINGNGVKVDDPAGSGTTTLTTNQTGETSQVTQCTPDGKKCDTTSVNTTTGAVETRDKVEVDANGVPKTDSQGNVSTGEVVSTTKTGPDGKDVTQVAIGDVNGDGKPDFINITNNGDGTISAESTATNTTWDGQGNMHRGTSGTNFGMDGSVNFSDGTSIDSHGNVSYKGQAMGSGGYDAQSEAATVARVQAILGLAASIASGASVDPGRIGQLMALFGELGNAQGQALQAGNLGAFMQADLAKAVVAGAISEQQASQVRQEMAKYFSDHPLSNDQLAQIQNQMRGVSAEQVNQFVKDHHWNPLEQRDPAGVK